MGRSGDPCMGLSGTPCMGLSRTPCMGKFAPHGDSKDEHTRPLPFRREEERGVSQQSRWSRERKDERSDVPMGYRRGQWEWRSSLEDLGSSAGALRDQLA